MKKNKELNIKDITAHKLHIDLITSYRFMDVVLKDFITFIFNDIKKDKYFLKFKPRLCYRLRLNSIELKIKIKSGDIRTIYLVIKRDITFINITPYNNKDCLFEMDTEDFFQNKEKYDETISQIKNEIKAYIRYWKIGNRRIKK